jgi:hypothetical protein
VVALVVCTSIALLACELGLRLLGIQPVRVAVGDPVVGFDNAPNHTETFDFPEYGGMLTMHQNNLGFREDRDTAVAKAPGVRRVVVIGDSQTAGECANTESYPNVWERDLNAGAGENRFEILNAGVGRYSPFQYYVKTERKLLTLKPDHLVVALYVGNDLMDLMRRDDRPYLVRQPDGSFEPHGPEFITLDDPQATSSLLDSSRVCALARRALGPTLMYQSRRARMLLHDAKGHPVLDVAKYMVAVKRLTDISLGFMTQSLLQQVWFSRFPETYAVAQAANKDVMRRFKSLCDANRIRLTYVILPTKLEVEPEDFKGVLTRIEAYDAALNLQSLQSFERRASNDILNAAREVGVEAVDLREPLLRMKNGHRFYNPEEMHLTPEGNRAVAKALRAMVDLNDAERP